MLKLFLNVGMFNLVITILIEARQQQTSRYAINYALFKVRCFFTTWIFVSFAFECRLKGLQDLLPFRVQFNATQKLIFANNCQHKHVLG